MPADAAEGESVDATSFDTDSFVLRRKLSAPDGEESSKGTRDPSPVRRMPPSSNKHRGDGRSRRAAAVDAAAASDSDGRRRGNGRGDGDSYTDDGDENDDVTSLAELTSYSSVADLHPHHKRRNGRHSDNEDADRRRNGKATGGRHRPSGRSDGRRKPAHSDGEEYDTEETGHRSRGSRGSRNSHSKRHSRHSRRSKKRSSGRSVVSSVVSYLPEPVGNAIETWYDGVNLKTVIVCLLGVAFLLKINHRPPPSSDPHGVRKASISDANPGVRGALVSEGGNLDGSNEIEDEEGYDKEDIGDGETGDDDGHEFTLGSVAGAVPAADGGEDLGDGNTDDGREFTHGDLSDNAAEGGGDAALPSNVAATPPPPDLPPEQHAGAVGQAPQYDPQQSQQQQQIYDPQQLQQAQQQGGYIQQQPVVQADGTAVAPGGTYAVGNQSIQPQQDPSQMGQVAGSVPQTTAGGAAVVSPLDWQQQQQQAQLIQPVSGAVDPSQQLQPPPQQTQPADQPGVGADAPQAAAPQADAQAAAQPTGEVAPADPAAAAGGAPQEGILTLLNNFKDTWDPYEKTDIPMFWHIPKAGGSSIKDTMGGCHRFVQATEFGVTDGHDQDTEVAIVYPAVPGVADTDRSPFVNIDSTTVAGIQRAKAMGFADANLAQLVVSPFVFETNDLFTQTAKGRLFSVFRHPIERAVSMFYYIRVADWEPSYKPELKDWTLEQYATSDIVENNWMTRQLSNQLGGELTDDNLRNAMEVVRTKFLVGLMRKIEPTMARVEKFFRMTYRVNPTNQEACRERLMSGGANSNAANKKPLAEGDPAWEMLAAQNNFDLQLYGYIEALFEEQAAFVEGLPDEFRKVGGTCCKCDPPTFPPEGFTCPQAVKNQE